MEKLQNAKSIILIIVTALIVSFAFYWFELRPSNIKSYCMQHVFGIKNNDIDPAAWNYIKVWDEYHDRYAYCLHYNGL